MLSGRLIPTARVASLTGRWTSYVNREMPEAESGDVMDRLERLERGVDGLRIECVRLESEVEELRGVRCDVRY